MIEQMIRAALQELGVTRVRNMLPALDTVGDRRSFDSCAICYALHGSAVMPFSKEQAEASALGRTSLPMVILSGIHYGGTTEDAQMLREEVMIFLAEHGNAPEPQITPEVACVAV